MPVVHPATPATDIANLMIAEDMGRICVVDPQSGALIGIIARRNLLSARAGKLREERERGAHETRLAWKRTDPNQGDFMQKPPKRTRQTGSASCRERMREDR